MPVASPVASFRGRRSRMHSCATQAARDLGDVAAEVDVVVLGQPRGDVVGVQDRGFGGGLQAFGAHHAHVHPADRQHRGIAQWRRRYRADLVGIADAGRAVRRQVGHEVVHHAHRPDPRAAAAVRNAEGLVQVQVAHITAELAGRGHADQRVHVRAVHIDPSAVAVHQRAQRLHLGVEHAVGRRVSDHHARQVRAVQLALGAQVGEVDIAFGVALRDDHLHARHLRARRVGAVRRFRDQADVAPALATRRVVGADHQQAGVFALRAGVRLQADAGVTGGLAEPVAQLRVELVVTGELLARREGVHVRELAPSDRNHLAGCVQLHRARAERDHRAVERQVLVRQAAEVAQHLRARRVMAVEHRVREERAAAGVRRVDERRDAGLEGMPAMAAASSPRRTSTQSAARSSRIVVSSSEMPRLLVEARRRL